MRDCLKLPTLLLAAALAAQVTACGGDKSCTLQAVVSARVTVEVPAEISIDDVTVTYTVAGGEPQACDFFDGSFLCGWEVVGELLIAASEPGGESTSDTVNVSLDESECHVETEFVTLQLTTSD